jgi:hypothetical protein
MNTLTTGLAIVFPSPRFTPVIAAGSTGSILLWLGVLLAVTLLGGLGIMWLRRRLLAKDTSSPGGFDLHSLRQLRDRGDLSPAEYEHLKTLVIGQARARPHGAAADNDPARALRPKQGPP